MNHQPPQMHPLLEQLTTALADTGDDLDIWQDQAICAQTDPEAWFPEKGGSTREAKAVCRGCTVRVECLQDALDHDERFGIWGGYSERERRKMKHKNAAAIIAAADFNQKIADAETAAEEFWKAERIAANRSAAAKARAAARKQVA